MRLPLPFVLACLLLCQLAISCKDDGPKIKQKEVPAVAGIYDEGYYYSEPSPALSFGIQYGSDSIVGVGAFTMDLDDDGSKDLDMGIRVINPDSLVLFEDSVPPYTPLLTASSYGGVEMAYFDESDSIPSFPDDVFFSALPVPSGTRIDSSLDWQSLSYTTGGKVLWNEHYGVHSHTYGPLYWERGITYLAIRQRSGNIYKYGWIELDNSDPYDPQFLRWALQE